jgi:DHA3 family tetracycline resistance protein-like MFS transporter
LKNKRSYYIYLFLEGASSLLFSLAFTYNIVYQTSVVNLSPMQLVLIGTVLESSIFIFEVPTGIVADLYSRRLSVIIGVFLIGMGILLEGSIPLFTTILLAQVLWGVGYTFTSGATQAWISDEIGEAAAGKAFLRGNQVGLTAAVIGIAASMVLASVRVNLPIQTGGILFLVLGVILIACMPEHGFTPTAREERSSWQNMRATFRSGLQMTRRRPVLITILLIGLFYGLYSEAYDRMWVKLLLDNFTLPALGELDTIVWFGIINAAGMLMSVAVTEVVRRRLDTNSHRSVARILMAITTVLIAGLLGYAFAGSFGFALGAYWVIGISRRLIGPIYTTWVNQRLEPGVRATLLSMSSQVDAIGQIAGGPLLGMVGNLFSVRAAIGAAGMVLSPVLLLYTRTIRKGDETRLEPSKEKILLEKS